MARLIGDDANRSVRRLVGVAATVGVFAARSWLLRNEKRIETGAVGGSFSLVVGASVVAVGAAFVRRRARDRQQEGKLRAQLVTDAPQRAGDDAEPCQCRICRDPEPRSELVAPCDCRGSLARAAARAVPPPQPHKCAASAVRRAREKRIGPFETGPPSAPLRRPTSTSSASATGRPSRAPTCAPSAASRSPSPEKAGSERCGRAHRTPASPGQGAQRSHKTAHSHPTLPVSPTPLPAVASLNRQHLRSHRL